MIKRIFSVVIDPLLREEFEDKFHNVASLETLSSKGCLSVQIYKPTVCNPNTYLMISEWESFQALEDKFGENWQQAYIPENMKRYECSHSIHHYQLW